MTNSKFKLLLDNLRALILKSRPAYRDYIGTEDVIEKTVLISGKLSADGESVNAKDTFKGFVEGETYKVTVGDETVDATAQYGTGSFSGCIVIGSSNVMPSDEIPGWMICVYNGNLLGYGTGEWTDKPVEVFTERTVKVDRWDVKKLPEECLPDGLAKQKDVAKQAAALKQMEQSVEDLDSDMQMNINIALGLANDAQDMASNAQSTANTALSTANTANAAASKAQSTANSVANTAATKKDPVFTGTFSQNRQSGTVIGSLSHAEGSNTTAAGSVSHAEGTSTKANGNASHAEGNSTVADGHNSHTEGYQSVVTAFAAHAEGYKTTASGENGSHAEGYETTASGKNGSHAEGRSTMASGWESHAEGQNTTASGQDSHAEGCGTVASASYSHAEGYNTIAARSSQHVEGKYNIADNTVGGSLHIVGNGTSDKARSNAHTLDESGNAWYAGDVYVGSTSGTNKDEGSKKLATEEYVGDRSFTFTITPVDGQVSPNLSATRAEMLAALDAGKTLLGYWTETRTILETTDTIKHEFRLESVSGTGASRGLAFVSYEQFYKSTLYVNGNDTISFVDKERLPIPTTKTDAMTQSVGMDDNGRLWTEPGASGNVAPIIYVNKSSNAYTDAECQNQYSFDGLYEAVQAGAKVYYRENTNESWTIYNVLTTVFNASDNTRSVVFCLDVYTDGTSDWRNSFTDNFAEGQSAPRT